MRIRDLGTLEGPVLLFGGPYSNLQATDALIDVARAKGLGPDNVISTGDVVAYCADAAETVARVRDFGCPVVAGNMEISLGAGASECGCGFEDGTACDLMAGAWFAHASAQIGAQDRAWMAACPDWIVFAHLGQRYGVVHGAPSDVARFLWPVDAEAVFAQEWQVFEEQAGAVHTIISGHSGVEFIRKGAFGVWINAGVIGMPPHDGAPDTRFVVLDDTGPRIERLSYDHDTAATRMEAAGLTQGYHTALRTGYWPSEDVLPLSMRVPSRASG